MKVAIRMVASLATLCLVSSAAENRTSTVRYEYAVKCACGLSVGPLVAPGHYFTAVNIHNPTDDTARVRWKMAVALPNRAGPVSEFAEFRLAPNEAYELDCPTIMKRAHADRSFVKGFVVIQSPVDLDVVTVYSAAGASRQVETMHVERTPARRFGGCPDLVVDRVDEPVWDARARKTQITAIIRNAGSETAAPTLARLVDVAGGVPSGATNSAVVPTPALPPGASVTLTFTLSYSVFHPDAHLEVTADYKNDLPECNESNNVGKIERIG